MSIQTQINRLNTAVSDQATLISQVRAAMAGKVGGASGGSVATATGRIDAVMAPVPDHGRVYYTDGSMTFRTLQVTEDTTITAAVGTILVIESGDISFVDGNVQRLAEDAGINGVEAYVVMGDFTVDISTKMG